MTVRFPTQSSQSILAIHLALPANLRTFANLSDGMPSFYKSWIVITTPFGRREAKQDHSYIKKITKPMMGFKSFHSAKAHILRAGTIADFKKYWKP